MVVVVVVVVGDGPGPDLLLPYRSAQQPRSRSTFSGRHPYPNYWEATSSTKCFPIWCECPGVATG